MVSETLSAKAKAQDLLRALVEAKSVVEQRGNPASTDLYKKVKGESSLEAAIASATRMVETYDRVLVELEGPRAPVMT
ncbi:MAG: hypothetical protein HUU18_08040 [Phycisphaerales bacterium]|jgi:hypothetical protein|nr:hypothetical protein [Phycisphaerales bacterium]